MIQSKRFALFNSQISVFSMKIKRDTFSDSNVQNQIYGKQRFVV